MSPQEPLVTDVILIEDQVSYGDAFALALSMTTDLSLVARASDGETGVKSCIEMQPDVIVTDYRLPGGTTGTDIATTLRASGLTAPIGVLTGFLAPRVQREAAELEQVHTFSKDRSINEIIAWVRAMVDGTVLETGPASRQTLSAGELEVLELLNQGNSPAEIAEILFLSLHTIRSRIKSTHRKLNVASQVEAIAVATRMGLLVPPS